jgi:hypothetical protein
MKLATATPAIAVCQFGQMKMFHMIFEMRTPTATCKQAAYKYNHMHLKTAHALQLVP